MSLTGWFHRWWFWKGSRNRGSDMLKETKELYTSKSGEYKNERKALHEAIINELLRRAGMATKSERPCVYFFGGGSGSGKTTLKEKMLKEHPPLKYIKAINVDPDEIKLYLPEFELYKQMHPQKAALLVHKESCDIRDLLVDRLIKEKRNFIYESTMAKPKKYMYLFKRLKAEGFRIHLYLSNVPISIAKKRISERARFDGRVIPIKVIENTHQLVPKTFMMVRDLTDSYHIYDNRKNILLITSCTVRDAPAYDEFIKKGSKTL